MSIYAKVIADSISPTGSRLTTVEAKFHRFILPEMLTHRAFSRNTASNRAIPTKKLIEQVRTDPAMPIEWGSNQPGMQAGPVLSGQDLVQCEASWKAYAFRASCQAENLLDAGVHKQIVNRLLEPFLWTTQIITSTQSGWNNFFAQRISYLAQPEINTLACAIDCAMSNSNPMPLGFGYWHLPYIDDGDAILNDGQACKVSAARCARVSYLTHEGKRDIQKDLELYDKLITADPPHWSPLEHVATPDAGVIWLPQDVAPAPGNLDGWYQLRHMPECQ